MTINTPTPLAPIDLCTECWPPTWSISLGIALGIIAGLASFLLGTRGWKEIHKKAWTTAYHLGIDHGIERARLQWLREQVEARLKQD